MKRHRKALVLCVFFWAIAPRLADAGLIELIDQWSGPGPFVGAAFDWRLVCFSREESDSDSAAPVEYLKPNAASALVGILGPGCFFKPVPKNHRRMASLNLTFGFYNAKRNDLRYPEPRPDDDVRLTSMEPSAWVRVGPGVEVGTAAGIFWIGGPAFESFNRFYLRPIQVDLKPLVWIRPNALYGSFLELISIRAGLMVMPGSLSSREFGALPGYKADREFLKTFSVVLDLEPVMRRLMDE
jgi:hypothetical protein